MFSRTRSLIRLIVHPSVKRRWREINTKLFHPKVKLLTTKARYNPFNNTKEAFSLRKSSKSQVMANTAYNNLYTLKILPQNAIRNSKFMKCLTRNKIIKFLSNRLDNSHYHSNSPSKKSNIYLRVRTCTSSQDSSYIECQLIDQCL